MFFSKKLPVTWLVVGLGNPGDKYAQTRHNAGFMTIDHLAQGKGFSVSRVKYQALTYQGELGGQGVLVMKPTTYMNLSGDAVAQAAAFYKIPPEHIIVVCDDVSLPLGKLRIRASGSAGGHNGLKSIIARLGSDKFLRVRMGVGEKPHPDYNMADWVLGKFVGEDLKTIQDAARRAGEAVECILSDGPQKAMNKFN